jgi:hypothetical protein
LKHSKVIAGIIQIGLGFVALLIVFIPIIGAFLGTNLAISLICNGVMDILVVILSGGEESEIDWKEMAQNYAIDLFFGAFANLARVLKIVKNGAKFMAKVTTFLSKQKFLAKIIGKSSKNLSEFTTKIGKVKRKGIFGKIGKGVEKSIDIAFIALIGSLTEEDIKNKLMSFLRSFF